MKRSEMVQRLSDEFSDLAVFDDDDKWSANIIDFLEKQGMMPSTGIFLATGEFGTIKEVLEYAEIDFKPSWEPEE